MNSSLGSVPQAFFVRITLLMLFLLFITKPSDQLRFTSIRIPSLVQRGTNFWLVCQFELDQQFDGDQLYGVKWYKNLEEFYRYQIPAIEFGHNRDKYQAPQPQQQYFSQPGVNVRMRQSNATHVLLSNASLESEALYACEISTQNLSTIRYEKEIRVYDLPKYRVNIIGSKSRYSLGDRVDLQCSSDYSKPRPALAWFINDHRIVGSNQWFELRSEIKSKPNEPSLFKLNLGLKFRLTRELWISLLSNKVGQQQQQIANVSNLNQRNQSRQPSNMVTGNSSKSYQGEKAFLSHHNNQHQAYQLSKGFVPSNIQHIRLQCKYRLTEVSDITFNELVIATTDTNTNYKNELGDELNKQDSRKRSETETDSTTIRPTTENVTRRERTFENIGYDEDGTARKESTNGHQTVDFFSSARTRNSQRSKRSSGPNGRTVRLITRTKFSRQGSANNIKEQNQSESGTVLSKSSQENKIVQSKSPAREDELRRFVVETRGKDESACQMGALALQPDDPVIVEAGDRHRTQIEPEQSSKLVNSQGLDGEEVGRVSKSTPGDADDEREEVNPGQDLDERQLPVTKHLHFPSTSSSKFGSRFSKAISLNCMTLSNLQVDSFDAIGQQQSQLLDRLSTNNEANLLPIDESRSSSSPQDTRISLLSAGQVCADEKNRQRITVSGYTRYENQSYPLGQNQSNPQTRFRFSPSRSSQTRYATLSLVSPSTTTTTTTTTTNKDNNLYNNQDEQLNDSMLVPYLPATDLVASEQQMAPTQQQQQQHHHYQQHRVKQQQDLKQETLDRPVSTPPLLEWFINNQEAPKSSVRYSFDLPLLDQSAQHSRNEDSSRSSSIEDKDLISRIGKLEFDDEQRMRSSLLMDQNLQTSIDYSEYFANFDSRPIKQSLPISIELNGTHFTDPDSKARLRCSSTQAQVLLTDSAQLIIMVSPNDKGLAIMGSQGGEQNGPWHRRKSANHPQSWHHDKQSIRLEGSRSSGHSRSGSIQSSICHSKDNILLFTILIVYILIIIPRCF